MEGCKKLLKISCLLVACICSIVTSIYLSLNRLNNSYLTLNKTNKECSMYATILKRRCYGHPQLCWLHTVLIRIYGYKLTNDPFNMTPTYTFDQHAPLGYPPVYHSERIKCIVHKGKTLSLLREKAKLSNNMQEQQFRKGNVDIYGRTCQYNPYTEYKYNFSAHVNGTSVHIHVNETPVVLHGTMVHGNNLFGLVKTERTVAACKLIYYQCYMYKFVCPILDGNFQIEIYATYITFVRKKMFCKRNSWILKRYACNLFETIKMCQEAKYLVTNNSNATCKHSKSHKFGFWLKVGKTFHWSSKECYHSFALKMSQVKCLREKKIIMIGDSHTRNRMQAIQSAYDMPKMSIKPSTFATDALCALWDVYKMLLKPTEKVDVIVVNTGAHDYGFLDIVIYIATMNEIIQVVQKISDLRNPPKVIWVETTPVANNGFHRGSANNKAIEACNAWINHSLENIGIEIIHAFDIAITMTSENRGDGQHYYHFLGRNTKYAPKVNVGGAVASVLVHAICPAI